MDTRATANVGVVLAAFAVAAAALPWGTAGVGPVENVPLAFLGAVAFAAFSLRRRDLLARTSGAALAGVASLAVVGYVAAVTSGALAVGSGAASPWGVGLALVGGVGGVIAAYGDGRGFPDRVGAAAKAGAWGLGVGFAGLFTMAVWAGVLVSLANGVVPGTLGTTAQTGLSVVASGLGTATVVSVYFQVSDRTLSYLDFRVPTLRDVGYVVGGIVVLFALSQVISVIFSQFGVRTATHSVEQTAEHGHAGILLLLIPASWLIIGPSEEMLYRNVIQKRFYPVFGEWGSVLAASVVFSLAHVSAYATGNSLASLASTLATIFVLSLILGTAYLRTENTLVSATIHGTYDAVAFAAMYLQLTGGP